VPHPSALVVRWYRGGHSTYFAPHNVGRTFQQIYDDIRAFQ
jgi:hypothetical protein